MYELSLHQFVLTGLTIDAFLQEQIDHRRLGMLPAAKALLVQGDTSRDGIVDGDELMQQFGIDATHAKHFVGAGAEGVSTVELLETLNVVILALAGYLPPA